MYIHERKDWPEFKWDQAKLAELLAEVRHLQGRLLGRMEALGFPLREEATLNTLTQDVVKTSEIEGEKLDAAQVRYPSPVAWAWISEHCPPLTATSRASSR